MESRSPPPFLSELYTRPLPSSQRNNPSNFAVTFASCSETCSIVKVSPTTTSSTGTCSSLVAAVVPRLRPTPDTPGNSLGVLSDFRGRKSGKLKSKSSILSLSARTSFFCSYFIFCISVRIKANQKTSPEILSPSLKDFVKKKIWRRICKICVSSIQCCL